MKCHFSPVKFTSKAIILLSDKTVSNLAGQCAYQNLSIKQLAEYFKKL